MRENNETREPISRSKVTGCYDDADAFSRPFQQKAALYLYEVIRNSWFSATLPISSGQTDCDTEPLAFEILEVMVVSVIFWLFLNSMAATMASRCDRTTSQLRTE